MKFLLIDDDDVFTSMLARALVRRGHLVDCAVSDVAARQVLARGYERIVLDLHLGGESGLKLLPMLRQQSPVSAILVLTGFASIATAVEATKLGAVQYLAKPATVDEILQAFCRVEPDAQLPIGAQPMSVRRLTWEHVQRVLVSHEGNVSATARALNMHRRTLQRMLAKKPVNH